MFYLSEFDKIWNTPKYKDQESWSNKNHHRSSQFTEYFQNQVQYTAENIEILVIPFSFIVRNFKLKSEAITDEKLLLVTELTNSAVINVLYLYKGIWPSYHMAEFPFRKSMHV